jgi:hypothetical protein
MAKEKKKAIINHKAQILNHKAQIYPFLMRQMHRPRFVVPDHGETPMEGRPFAVLSVAPRWDLRLWNRLKRIVF